MWVGVILYINVAWLFILFIFVFWMYYERIIYAEEVFLRQKFGNTYLKWAEKTPVFMPKNCVMSTLNNPLVGEKY